jgi:DNA-binding NtrC family response regulator
MVFKILYEMRGSISDLKREMNSMRKQLDEAHNLAGAAFGGQITSFDSSATALTPVGTQSPSPIANIEEADAEEIREPETLNLSHIGRQMLEKALERNGGNRKKAAQELGISDRTLYRRIKQYGLDKDKQDEE